MKKDELDMSVVSFASKRDLREIQTLHNQHKYSNNLIKSNTYDPYYII